MIRINNINLGFTAFSTILLFITLSICAVTATCHHTEPESSVSLSSLLANESMALLATLIYGICAHFAVAAINYIKKKNA
ncbi:MAG: hypothetical protein K2G47_07265 [Muribaculum sp.]|nr:hypothetical protein [Muribaculum sp.]